MSFEQYSFKSPVEIAKPFAESIGMGSDFNHEFHKNITLSYLDQTADDLGVLGNTYFTETNKAFSIPASFDADKEVSTIDFNKITFEGPYVCHSLVQIGRIGNYSVRALCLSFSEATLLPYFDQIPESHILHVPVLAIDDMIKTN